MISTNVYVDVENTLTVPFLTGIQRTTIQLLTHLWEMDDERSRFLPVTYCQFCGGWLQHPTKGLFLRRHRPASNRHTDSVQFAASKLLEQLSSSALTRKLGYQYRRATHDKRRHKLLLLPRFEPGSVFFDIDSSWHNRFKRSQLLPALNKDHVAVCTMHYDMIPVLMPDVTHPNTVAVFRDHFQAHLIYSSLFVCISETTKSALAEYCRRCSDLQALPELRTIRLGDGFVEQESDMPEPPSALKNRRYILSVGTIEPRKNYETLLDAFDELVQAFPDLRLVIVGREGWNAEATVSRLRRHNLNGTNVFWYSNLSDDELRGLYRGAFLYVSTSTYEGFGLPVSEALGQGCVTITSSAGALREAGGVYVDYFSPQNSHGLVELVRKLILNPDEYTKRKLKIRQRPPNRWHDTARQLLDVLNHRFAVR